MKPISKFGAWTRCLLVTTAAAIAYLQGDSYFRDHAAAVVMTYLGLTVVVLLNIRNWLDQSHSQSKEPDGASGADADPLTVATAPDKPTEAIVSKESNDGGN